MIDQGNDQVILINYWVNRNIVRSDESMVGQLHLDRRGIVPDRDRCDEWVIDCDNRYRHLGLEVCLKLNGVRVWHG